MRVQHRDERGRVVCAEVADNAGQPHVVAASDERDRIGGEPERRAGIDAQGCKPHRRERAIGARRMQDAVVRGEHRVGAVGVARGRTGGHDETREARRVRWRLRSRVFAAIRRQRGEVGEREDEMHRSARRMRWRRPLH